MASSDQIKTALLTEHFRYTPLTLLDDIINTVNEVVYQAVNAVEEGLLSVDPAVLGFQSSEDVQQQRSGNEADTFSTARTEIEAGIVQLESLLNATIDKNFDKLEIYTLRNLLTVSNLKEDDGLENWVMLDHYKDLRAPVAGSGRDGDKAEAATPESVQLLRRKVQETEKLQSVLRAEAAKNEALLQRLRPLVPRANAPQLQSQSQTADGSDGSQGSFAFLTEMQAASSLGLSTTATSQPLAQNTRFTLSQLPALKALLETLRPHLGGVPGAASSGAAEAREAYIDGRSRRAMAKRGIDADALAGNGAEGLGRPLGKDEVRALEGIVGAIGGNRDGRGLDKMEE